MEETSSKTGSQYKVSLTDDGMVPLHHVYNNPEGILRFGGILPDFLSTDKVFSSFPQLKSCNIHNLLLDIEKVLCYNGQQVKKNRNYEGTE